MTDFPGSLIDRLVTPLQPGVDTQMIDDGDDRWTVTAQWYRGDAGYLLIHPNTIAATLIKTTTPHIRSETDAKRDGT